jgi:CheY-like chemotaxis protein
MTPNLVIIITEFRLRTDFFTGFFVPGKLCINFSKTPYSMVQNILLVDDNEMDNFVAKRHIEKTNLAEQITIKLSGKQAIDYLNDLQKSEQPFPEIILLDINMPVMDGFAFLNKFNTYPSQLINKSCIFILTSSSDSNDRHEAQRFNLVKGYFVKPFTIDQAKQIEEYYTTILNE